MNINKKVQRRIEKLLGRNIYWDTNRSTAYTNENLERVYVDFKVNGDETQFKLTLQNVQQGMKEITLHTI